MFTVFNLYSIRKHRKLTYKGHYWDGTEGGEKAGGSHTVQELDCRVGPSSCDGEPRGYPG